MTKDPKEGWGFPANSRKAHYFVAGRSLCNKWLYTSSRLDQGNDRSPDNCAACKRKLKKLKEGKSVVELEGGKDADEN